MALKKSKTKAQELAKPLWRELAKAFLADHITGDGELTFRKKNRLQSESFSDGVFYVEVLAISDDGSIHQVLIDPDAMRINRYERFAGVVEYKR